MHSGCPFSIQKWVPGFGTVLPRDVQVPEEKVGARSYGTTLTLTVNKAVRTVQGSYTPRSCQDTKYTGDKPHTWHNGKHNGHVAHPKQSETHEQHKKILHI